jgi:branched-chain amino acid transport system ATP-binding protein
MQQPDADLDAVLPIAPEEIIAETPTEEVTGLTPEVSPYAYVAPPAAVLDRSGRPPLLSAEKVNFAYGSVPVLFDVDITVGEGELVAVLGPNGVGKTTLLRCLSGLEIPQQGVVRFNGDDVTRTTASRRVGLGLSQIVGGNAVFGSLTVAENLQMYGYSAGGDRKKVAAGIDRAYEIFPRLADRRSQLGSTLSGGEQQMLGLSKALILQPHLLVVDEFSLGLAPVVVGELLAMVRQLNSEGTAVLLVEQSVNVALNLVDRCYFMEKGRVVYEGHSEALRARPDLVQALSLGGLPHELEESAV